MKNFKFYLLAFSCCLFITISSCSKDEPVFDEDPISLETNESLTSRKGNSPSASGQGGFLFGDNERRFSFHANTMPDGSVKGNGVLTYTGGAQKIMFNIDCLTIIGDNTAAISGVVTKWKSSPESVGTAIYFKVVDNGEGNKADADLMSAMSVNLVAPFDCSNYNVTLYSLVQGNVQVNQ